MTMTEEQRREHLASLGLTADGDSLSDTAPAKEGKKVKLAPKGVDPHTMPVTEIVFDPRLVDDFDLDTQFKAASDHVFAQYRAPGKNADRHSLLHGRISKFLGQVRMDRKAGGGHVRNEIKATSEERALAKLLASKKITVADLMTLLGGE